MNLIIVNGHPASGKTSISTALATCTDFKLISRDDIKERLYDEQISARPFGVTDIEWSQKLGGESFELLFKKIDKQLSEEESLIIESPFKAETHSVTFQNMIKEFDVPTIQLLLHCDTDELQKRFMERFERGERHPAHVDNEYFYRFNKGGVFARRRKPLELTCTLIEIDTTVFSTVDTTAICTQVKDELHIE